MAQPHQITMQITGILGHRDTVNAYFLVDKGQAVLVDSGQDAARDRQRILDEWRALGEPEMQKIVLTHGHPDHIGAAAELREFWQVPIHMHPADAPILAHLGQPFTPDVLLQDGQELDTPLGAATVIHTPGHAPGHVVLHFEGSGTLVSGDQVITNGTVYVGEPLGNMTEYLESMQKLLRKQVGLLAPGHGDMVLDGWQHMMHLHEYRLRREGEYVMALRTGAKSALEIAGILYRGRDLPEAVLEFGARQTEAHLQHLQRSGVAFRDEAGWHLGRKPS